MKRRLIGGIDEAGRGPLAGPVSLALLIAPRGFKFRHPRLGAIRDSKRLTPLQREMWYAFLLRRPQLRFYHTFVSHSVIDRINIRNACNRGALRLARRAIPAPDMIFLDGSLSLPPAFPHRTVIGGDEKIPVIAAASIIAKVRRDRYMRRMARKFPAYGFERHKGYGTKFHFQLIKAAGFSVIHRRTFLKNFSV